MFPDLRAGVDEDESRCNQQQSALRRGRGARGRATPTTVGLKKVVRTAVLSVACVCLLLLLAPGVDATPTITATASSTTMTATSITVTASSTTAPSTTTTTTTTTTSAAVTSTLGCDRYGSYYYLADSARCWVDDINEAFGGRLDKCFGNWHLANSQSDCEATAAKINNANDLYTGPDISCYKGCAAPICLGNVAYLKWDTEDECNRGSKALGEFFVCKGVAECFKNIGAKCNGIADPFKCYASASFANTCSDAIIGTAIENECPVMCGTCANTTTTNTATITSTTSATATTSTATVTSKTESSTTISSSTTTDTTTDTTTTTTISTKTSATITLTQTTVTKPTITTTIASTSITTIKTPTAFETNHSIVAVDDLQTNEAKKSGKAARNVLIVIVCLFVCVGIPYYYCQRTAWCHALQDAHEYHEAYVHELPHLEDTIHNQSFVGITLEGLEHTSSTDDAATQGDSLYDTIENILEAQVGANRSKFVVPTIRLGRATQAAAGLADLMGYNEMSIVQHIIQSGGGIEAIMNEVESHGTEEDKKNLRGLLNGTYTNPPNSNGDPPTPAEVIAESKTIDELMQTDEVKMANLQRAHVLALRLYTTSTYASLNSPLRTDPATKPHPLAATTYFASEGIKKLRQVAGMLPTAHKSQAFWRGMKDLTISKEFLESGGTEFAFMSTSVSMEVAIDFARSDVPMVVKLEAKDFMSCGANISWLSVYPGENETLFPPLTFLRPIKQEHFVKDGVTYLLVRCEPVIP